MLPAPMSGYHVDPSKYDDLDLEETLADNLSGHASVEIPVSKAVFVFAYAGIAIILMAIFFQAIRLQGFKGEAYALQADRNRFHRYPMPGIRGNIVDVKGTSVVTNIPSFDIVLVQAEFDIKNLDRLSTLISKRVTLGTAGVVALKKDIDKSLAVSVQAARMPGVYVVPTARRSYPLGAAMAHVIGYTSEVSQDEIDTNTSLQAGDRLGRTGIEKYYETYLHGPIDSVALVPDEPITSDTQSDTSVVHLTIDADIQKKLYESTASVFREYGVTRGAAIVQEVKTGKILGMVSLPASDEFNRAVSGLYSPGSTIKPLYALAGLAEHIVTPSTLVYSAGSIEVPSSVGGPAHIFRDWKAHGWTDLRKSIAWSVDVYYYALGGGLGDISGLGIDRISKYLKIARADVKTGLDISGEVAGFVPTKEWKQKERGEPWYLGDTYNISIGQGDLQVTPIWLSTYVSAVANGGHFMKPYLVSSITRGGKEVYTREAEALADLPFDAATIRVVQEGMRQTITDGTAMSLGKLPRAVAAKTGTAQVTGQKLNSLFITYGPYEDPEISITVLIEHISGNQSLGVMVAKRFYEWYFSSHV